MRRNSRSLLFAPFGMNNNLLVSWLELDRTILVSGKKFVRTFLNPWASLCYCFSPDVDGLIIFYITSINLWRKNLLSCP